MRALQVTNKKLLLLCSNGPYIALRGSDNGFGRYQKTNSYFVLQNVNWFEVVWLNRAKNSNDSHFITFLFKFLLLRRETYITVPCSALPHMEEEEESRLMPEETPEDGVEDCRTPDRLDSTNGMSDWLLFGDAGKS